MRGQNKGEEAAEENECGRRGTTIVQCQKAEEGRAASERKILSGILSVRPGVANSQQHCSVETEPQMLILNFGIDTFLKVTNR